MPEHPVPNGLVTKIVLQQPSRLLRDMMVHWLTTLPGYVVVGVTDAEQDLVRLCRRCSPDVVVLDIGSDRPARPIGYPVVERSRMPYLIGLYTRLDVIAVPRLLRAGVQQLVSVQSGLGGLHAALQAARTARRPAAAVDLLTARELEVLALICSGWPTARIASALGISPHTVINHTRRIFTKLNVRSRTQAAAEASARGLFHESLTHLTTAQPVVLVDPSAEEWSAARVRGGDVVVVLSDPASGGDIAEAVARGAKAVLGVDALADQMPLALAMVRRGYLVAPAEPVRALIATARPNEAVPALTRRERDILNSVARGDSVRQTAQALGIAMKTVQNVQRQLFCRLGAHNRTQALMLARGLGLVEPDRVEPDRVEMDRVEPDDVEPDDVEPDRVEVE